MYADEDGIASKQSEAAYHGRLRVLLSTTSLISWLGFGMAVLNGDYARERLYWDHLSLHYWSKILWASQCHSKAHTLSLFHLNKTNTLYSLFYYGTALLFTGMTIPSNSMPQGCGVRCCPLS